MREAVTQGIICLTDPETDVQYRVADIEYREREDETFVYAIAPRYEVADLLSPPLFQGIPGLNLDLRLPVYARENRTPVFVSERVPAENREDVRELLDETEMDYLDKLEWLIRTDTRYSGDNLYVIRQDNAAKTVDVGNLEGLSPQTAEAAGQILGLVARGSMVEGEGFSIDDGNRKAFHNLLRALYLKGKGPRVQPKRTNDPTGAPTAGPGRRRKPVDDIRFEDAVARFEAGRIPAAQAAYESGLSRATFFRRLKERRKD